MVGVVLRPILYVQASDGVGDEINIDDIHAVFRAERQDWKSRQEHESAHHVELRGFRPAAVTENNAWAKNRLGNFRQQLRSEEHTSELQSHSFISYAVF